MTQTYTEGWSASRTRIAAGEALAMAILFIMLLLPLTHQPIKYVLLGVLIGGIVARSMIGASPKWHPLILHWTSLMVLVGLSYMLYGLFHGGPGAVRVGTIYVVWPLAYTFFIGALTHRDTMRRLVQCILIANIGISIFLLSFVLNKAGFLPDSLYFHIEQEQRIGFREGYVQIVSYSLYSLFFTQMFVMAALFTWPNDDRAPVSRFWLWVSAGFGAIIILLSGRRALWLVFILAPFITFALWMACSRRGDKTAASLNARAIFAVAGLFVALGAIAFSIFDLNFTGIVGRFIAAFDSGAEHAASVRRMQISALIAGWQDQPIFGNGLGTGAPLFVRVFEKPWLYEMSYLALLFHTGLVGFLVYGLAVSWIFYMGIRMIRSGHLYGYVMLPMLVGLSGILIANGTNPYLSSFDSIWTIFLPVALINLWIVETYDRESAAAESHYLGKVSDH